MKKAFTMIELIFVIVILGILAAVAVPKFGDTKNQADIAKARSEIASIRAGIVNERQERLIKGDSAWISPANLDSGSGVFGGVLMYSLTNENKIGKWYAATEGDGNYTYKMNSTSVSFEYNSSNGIFTCDSTDATTGESCKKLIN